MDRHLMTHSVNEGGKAAEEKQIAQLCVFTKKANAQQINSIGSCTCKGMRMSYLSCLGGLGEGMLQPSRASERY